MKKKEEEDENAKAKDISESKKSKYVIKRKNEL